MNNIKVLLSCDDNPFYYNFWNDVSYVWKQIFNFDPVLIYVSDVENNNLSSANGQIIRVNKIENIPTYLQAQLARVYYTSLYKNDVCMLSDIDMIPINKSFFNKEKILEHTKDNSMFHLNPTPREFGQYPMCYYCGTGQAFAFATSDKSWENFMKEVVSCNFSVNKLNYNLPSHLKGKDLWFSDELFLYTKLNQTKTNIKINNQIIKSFQRLDREQILSLDHKSINNYIDCHMPRPFDLYEKQINYIIHGIENAQ